MKDKGGKRIRQPVVARLEKWIERKGHQKAFDRAIRNAQKHELYDFQELAGWKDYRDYSRWLDALLRWAPDQDGDTRRVYEKIVKFYFILDQEPVRELQSPVKPGKPPKRLTWLSRWMVDFARAWGAWLDTTESAAHVDSFRSDPLFTWDEYMPPPSGYLTFNQFFARHVKPGMRPIAGLGDDAVVVSPADSTFVGWWQIGEDSNIYVQGEKNGILEVKGLQWSIHDLLRDSAYADRFRGGIFTHSFLNSNDYHRWHAPVRGTVLEARVIQGQVYLDVEVAERILPDGEVVNVLSALDGTGYQFVQTRGLIVIDSPIGLVACLPMGMAQVSSVVITAEPGVTLHKGEELGYFQFGGSDWVMVFERASNVQLVCQPGVHYNQGIWIGTAAPYSLP